MIVVLTVVTFGVTVLLSPVRADPMYPCCQCGPPQSHSIVIKNNVKSPNFEESIEVESGRREVIYSLVLAAMENNVFEHTVAFTNKDGYTLKEINGTPAGAGFYWKLLSNTGNGDIELTTGLSHYVPSPGEIITIALTRGSPQ